MDYSLALIIAVVIGIAVAILVVLLTINTSKEENKVSTVTLTCENNTLDKIDLTLPSSFPFYLETTTLGAGALALFYYSDAEYTNPLDSEILQTQSTPLFINPPAGTKGIQYVFICSAVDRVINVSTSVPLPLIPYIPYGFRNASIASDLSVTVTGTQATQTLPVIAPNNIGYPNPAYGWSSYTAIMTP